MQGQIITSLLDNDFYNFTMGQLTWKRFPGVHVTYRFICRTPEAKLGRLVDVRELNRQLAAQRDLCFSEGELAFLRASGPFGDEYLDYLRALELPEVVARRVGDELEIEYTGLWSAAIFWETPILALVTELATRERIRGREDEYWAEGRRRAQIKLELVRRYPRIAYSEFGTRRRAAWDQQTEIAALAQQLTPNQLAGTSNVWLAMQLDLKPVGTIAHQPMMVITALEDASGNKHPIAAAQKIILDAYEEMYGDYEDGRLLIFLPDTFGTATALALFDRERAERWHGFRQDSGDPFEIGELIVAFWERHGIDPRTKVLMFSDGLDVETMIRLYEHFGHRTQVLFGIGTNLTNDIGLSTYSIVIKPSHLTVGEMIIWIVKLSDNLAKATGDPATIDRRKSEADYHVTYDRVPVS